jgi:uncharacterized heparinase superfamily protein
MAMQVYETASNLASAPGGFSMPHVPWLRLISVWANKQLHAELFGMPGYGLTLRGPVPDGFIASPRDIRPMDTMLAKTIMAGRFSLAGARMSFQGSGDPWNRPAPSRAFAVELHRFSWLSALMAYSDEGAKEALRLIKLWHETFKVWTPFSWSEEVLPRRLINLSINARKLAALGGAQDAIFLAKTMSEQGRHVMRLSKATPWKAEQAVALILIGCVLSGTVGDDFRKAGLKALPRALKRVVLSDGCHATRSPERAVALLYDLLLIEDAMGQRGLPLPEHLEFYLETIGRAVRTLCHPDGSLCAFQGAESLGETHVMPALVHLDSRQSALSVPDTLEQGRFQRLIGRSLMVFVDVGEPKSGILGHAACDQAMAFELSGGRDKLIVLPGWSPQHSDHQIYRLMTSANTLTLDGKGILSPVMGKIGEMLNFALEGKKYKVRSRRVEAEDTGSLLEMEHDAWRAAYGLRHERRLYVDAARDELRGEDRLTPLNDKKPFPETAVYELRFHLHPEVQASLARDKKSVLLRGPGGRGWWLRHDAKEVAIDRANIFEQGELRKSLVILLRGTCACALQNRIRWKLSPAEN